ncbi:hypothetical protein IWX78_001973 [Mycetocola sp. CAN_C7]|uniref:hypothetical protein n=1 Tax=Mycetocola sp. CAN_C7 TaxID=2787724 RepID=UPI0018C9BC23
MTNDNDGTQRPGGPWGEPQPTPPNPYTQGQPPQDPSVQGQPPQNPYAQGQPAQNPYTQGRPQQDPHAQAPAEPNPHGQAPAEPNPYGQAPAEPNPYGQAPAQPNPYGQVPQNPYSERQGASDPTSAQPTAAYPHAPAGNVPPSLPGGPHAPTEVYPPFGGQPPVAPRKKKRSPAGWIAAAVVLVLLIVGGIVGFNIGSAAHAPELQVQAYLDALKSGKAESALKLAGTKVEETDLLLTDEAYANAEDLITRYTISDSTVDGDSATVTASITQGGEKYDQDFTLTKAGTDMVLFDKWALEAPDLGAVAVPVTAPDDAVIEVGGVDASSARSEGTIELRALPGTYAVALGGEAAWYDAEPTTASVLGFGEDAAEVEPLVIALTDEGTQAATDAVDAWLDACIASTELVPPGCPFSASNSRNYEISNLVWTVTKPTFTIGEYSDGTWAIVTDTEGEAKATADAKDPSTGGTGQIFTDPFSFEVGGVIEGFTDDGATFVPSE